jgi:hypothetical protein
MAEPARGGADGERPAYPEAAVLDPRKLIWADVKSTIITCAHAAGLAVTELARRPDDAAALEMAALTREAFERAVGMGSQWVVDEALLEAEGQRRFDEGVAACKAARCRLQAVDGG